MLRIQGISVEIGGDTTKLQTALKGVNTEIRNTQSQLRDVDKLLKLDPGNTELLAQKHRLLGDAVQETKQKLETLKTASEQANEALKNGTITQEQYDGLPGKIWLLYACSYRRRAKRSLRLETQLFRRVRSTRAELPLHYLHA